MRAARFGQRHRRRLESFPWRSEKLPQNGDGTFRFLVNLPQFLGAPGKILRTRAGDITIMLVRGLLIVRDTADHLSKRRELFGLHSFEWKTRWRQIGGRFPRVQQRPMGSKQGRAALSRKRGAG